MKRLLEFMSELQLLWWCITSDLRFWFMSNAKEAVHPVAYTIALIGATLFLTVCLAVKMIQPAY